MEKHFTYFAKMGFGRDGVQLKKSLGSIHIAEQHVFTLFPSIIDFHCDPIMLYFLAYRGLIGLFLGIKVRFKNRYSYVPK